MSDIAIVIIDQHEPEGETAGRLLEIAQEKGLSPSVVEAQRGEHDARLSFRVPKDVAEQFNAEREDRWPLPDDGAKIENDDAEDADQQVPEADAVKAAEEQQEPDTAKADHTPNRRTRTGQANKE